MMEKKYCLDTSGLTTPLEQMPADIHLTMWSEITEYLEGGHIAVSPEIFAEMCKIEGALGKCISSNSKMLVLDIGDPNWPWHDYVRCSSSLQIKYRRHLAEYRKKKTGTIGVNDLSVIAMAKVLDVPLISSEKRTGDLSQTDKRKIPDVCDLEGITHISLNEFLRLESRSF